MKAGTWILAVLLVSLMAMACPAADAPAPASDGKVEVTPGRPDVTYKADGGTYRRETTVIAPPWGSDSAKTISAIKPFQAEGIELPDFRSDGMDVRGGGGSFSGGGMESIQDVVRRGPVLLCVIGGLALLAGIVVAIWAGRVMLGLAVAAGGAVLIAAGVLFETYPWVVLIGALIAIALGIWWVVDARFAGRAKAALTAVVRGVEQATGSADVKAAIGEAAKQAGKTAVVKDTISQAKRQAGIT